MVQHLQSPTPEIEQRISSLADLGKISQPKTTVN